MGIKVLTCGSAVQMLGPRVSFSPGREREGWNEAQAYMSLKGSWALQTLESRTGESWVLLENWDKGGLSLGI